MDKILIKNLSFSYRPELDVLKEINLTFNHSPTAIIGQNGAGKTTFVKLLKGLLSPTQGDIFIKGKNTKNYSAARLAKDIGLVFQNPNDQIFKNTVLDEVMFGPLNLELCFEKAQKNSLEALRLVKIEDKIKKNPYDLSLAERKLIGIASVLAMDPDIVIFDEPTIAQDSQGVELIKAIIKDLNSKGKLVISITHDMDFVADCFSRVIVFQKGKIALDGTTEMIFSQSKILRSSFLEPPHLTQLGQKLALKNTILTIEQLVKNYR